MRTAAKKRLWSHVRGEADTLLSQSVVNLLEPWHEGLKGLFARQLEDKERPFTRRPQVALRLRGYGEQKLIVHPAWSRSSNEVRLGHLDCELLQGKQKRLTFGLKPDIPEHPQWSEVWAGWRVWRIFSTVVQDVTDALTVIEDYHTDWRKVLARSADYCCCCGRHLTDAISRSRGIGPECIKYFDYEYQTRKEA
jgi:hypothetical protein